MNFPEFKFPESLNWTESPVEAVRRVLPADSDCNEMAALLVGLMLGHQVDNPGMGPKPLYSASNSDDMDISSYDWDESRFDPEAWTYMAEDGTVAEVTEKQILTRLLAEVEPVHAGEYRRYHIDLSRPGLYSEALVCIHDGALREVGPGVDRWIDVITFRTFDEGGAGTLFLYLA